MMNISQERQRRPDWFHEQPGGRAKGGGDIGGRGSHDGHEYAAGVADGDQGGNILAVL